LVAMVLHVAADDGAIEDVESWEQRGDAVTFRSHTSSSRGPGFIGNPGRVRSSAWIWLFSSTERTTGTPRTSKNYTGPGAIRAGNVTGLGERGSAAAAVLKQSLRYWAGIALAIYSLCVWPGQFQARNRRNSNGPCSVNLVLSRSTLGNARYYVAVVIQHWRRGLAMAKEYVTFETTQSATAFSRTENG
jgi:hypothetical protein